MVGAWHKKIVGRQLRSSPLSYKALTKKALPLLIA